MATLLASLCGHGADDSLLSRTACLRTMSTPLTLMAVLSPLPPPLTQDQGHGKGWAPLSSLSSRSPHLCLSSHLPVFASKILPYYSRFLLESMTSTAKTPQVSGHRDRRMSRMNAILQSTVNTCRLKPTCAAFSPIIGYMRPGPNGRDERASH